MTAADAAAKERKRQMRESQRVVMEAMREQQNRASIQLAKEAAMLAASEDDDDDDDEEGEEDGEDEEMNFDVEEEMREEREERLKWKSVDRRSADRSDRRQAASETSSKRSSMDDGREVCSLCRNHTLASGSPLGFITFSQRTRLLHIASAPTAHRISSALSPSEKGPRDPPPPPLHLLPLESWRQVGLVEAVVEPTSGPPSPPSEPESSRFGGGEDRGGYDADKAEELEASRREAGVSPRWSGRETPPAGWWSRGAGDGTSVFVSTCSHAVHVECLESYCSSLGTGHIM
jgi:hypothetical protein